MKLPNVAIIDTDGYFPLNLNRSSLSTQGYPFGSELVEDFLSEMLAWFFFNGPTSIDSPQLSKIDFSPWLNIIAVDSFIAGTEGYALKLALLFQRMKIRHQICFAPGIQIQIVGQDTFVSVSNNASAGSGELVNLGFAFEENEEKTDQLKKNYTRRVLYEKPNNKQDKMFEVRGERFIYDSDNFLDSWGEKFLKHEEKQDGHFLYSINELECPQQRFVLDEKNCNLSNSKSIVLNEYFYIDGTYIIATSKPWLLDQLWEKFFGRKWIPFGKEERLRVFPETAKFLAERYPHVVPDYFKNLLSV